MLTNPDKYGILLSDERGTDFLLSESRTQSRQGRLNRFSLIAEMRPFLLGDMMQERNNLGQFVKGSISWNKGIPRSEAVKRAVSKAQLGRKWTNETRKKILKTRRLNPYIPTVSHREKVGNANRTKGGRKIDSSGYVYIYKPEYKNSYNGKHNKGYILEHRYIMEQFLSRDLKKSEAIHHLNGIKGDNRLENLHLCANVNKHTSIHQKEQRFVEKLIKKGKVYYDREKQEFRLR